MTTPQNSLTWFKFEVGWQQSSTDDMSNNALAIDTRLTYQAWSAPDGSCAVPMKRFLRLCEKAAADAELLYKELVDSERWVRSEDRKSLIAVWLLQKRAVADAIIEKRRRAGKASGVSRQPGKAARTAKPRPLREPKASAPMTADAPEHVLNTCSAHVHELTPEPLVYAHMHGIEDADAWRNSLHDNAPNMCSTPAEHVLNREACTSSSLPTVEEEEEQARTLAHAATAPPAS
ncbi:MAG: hypothetical protein H7099_11685, partial [Gemmatimonadaceae bacterium]|nr:hypothetical protein [Gemmatimonadaceae bacterium]